MSNSTAFLACAIEQGALRFGEFPLKSGRISPYFFNAGLFNSGAALARLGRFYARAIDATGIEFDMLFGPAYKGIPLVSTVAIALAIEYGRDIPYAFNRKEAKDHGEGGEIIGAPLAGRVLIIDDVITAGTAIREAIASIRAGGADPAGVAVALDRQEQGPNSRSAIQELRLNEGVYVLSIAGLGDLLELMQRDPRHADRAASIHAYREQYGA